MVVIIIIPRGGSEVVDRASVVAAVAVLRAVRGGVGYAEVKAEDLRIRTAG